MAKRFNQSDRKSTFLQSVSQSDIETSGIANKCSFNFHYFSPSHGGQTLDEWNEMQGACSLNSLMKKLVSFCASPLSYWEHERAGAGGLKVLSYYPSFPEKSSFQRPNCVPHDARWGRFRLGNKLRLAGFSIPSQNHGKLDKAGNILSSNIFYVVYLDMNHEFYPVEDA
ncbi:hypothetical protein ACEUB7_12080 [Aeromonas veronii]